MIVFSDPHLDESCADTVLGKVLPGIFEASQRLKDPVVACLGDFWNLRYKVDVALQNQVRDELKLWIAAGIKFLFLPGNHDQVDVAGRNALEVFDELGDYCRVFTQPTWNQLGLWVPYRKYPQDIEAALTLPRPRTGHDNVLWGHFGLEGAWMNDQKRDTGGIAVSTFDSFDLIVLGHYHKRQRLGKAYYVGSPRQVTAHEADQDKGFAVWNGKKLRFVQTQWGKRYHRIRLEPGEILDTSAIRSEDEVRVSTAVGIDPSVVGGQLAALGVQHAVTPDVVANESRLIVRPEADLDEYARGYVEQFPTHLDKARLIQTYEGLTA
jgi:hypothetical protein